MNFNLKHVIRSGAIVLFAAVVATGCTGIVQPGERAARKQISSVTKIYRPATLPVLTTNSSLTDFMTYAMLNQPQVAAAYYDWSASVENITVQRSLPDPQLTFQMDIMDIVTSIMPGFMQEFPGPGKLKARARVATAQSETKYAAFRTAVLQTAFNLTSAYYNLGLIEEQIQIKREGLGLLENQEQAVHAQNITGAMPLAGLLRIQNEIDRLKTDVTDLEDSRHSALKNFKAALGLTPQETAPPVPSHFEPSKTVPDFDDLFRYAMSHNPQLAAMQSEIRNMDAEIEMAYKERVPDFSLGLMADAKTSPALYRPLATMTLPIWRDKIAAEIAQAKANDMAAKARLKSAQIDLATTFAGKAFTYRKTSRNLVLIEGDLIPRTEQWIETVNAGYRTGSMDFASVTEAAQMLLDLKVEAAEDRVAREIALAELSIIIAGISPANAPLIENAH